MEVRNATQRGCQHRPEQDTYAMQAAQYFKEAELKKTQPTSKIRAAS